MEGRSARKMRHVRKRYVGAYKLSGSENWYPSSKNWLSLQLFLLYSCLIVNISQLSVLHD